MITTITRLLNELSELQSKADVINLRFDEQADSIMTAEIIDALAVVEADRALALDDTRQAISKQEARVRAFTLQHEKSVKADYLHAVYAKGRVSWDSKGLVGYAVAHPEVKAFRKVGKPSVSIRRAK